MNAAHGSLEKTRKNPKLALFCEFFASICLFWAFASDASTLASDLQMPTAIDFTMIFGGIGGKKSKKLFYLKIGETPSRNLPAFCAVALARP